MSSKQAKRARKAAKVNSTTYNPAVFIPATPNADILAKVQEAVRDGDTVEFIWDTISPWLWFEGQFTEAALKGINVPGVTPLAVYLSRDYQVAVYDESRPQGWPAMWHLSLKRRDRQPIDKDRWRILQVIKNTLVGPENEAVELYPGESRLVDTSNQLHLWVLKDPNVRFPFGFQDRLVTANPSLDAVQRPFDPALGFSPTEEDEAAFMQTAADAGIGGSD